MIRGPGPESLLGVTGSPVLVLGAHRSGTSLVTELLERLGVFMGRDLDQNREALFFVRRNEWLLRHAGGSWEEPERILSLLESDERKHEALEVLRRQVTSLHWASFVGRRAWVQSKLGMQRRSPWGWKDPRNAFTAPLWSELLGGARLICVERNGIDASRSLVEREAATTRLRAMLPPPGQLLERGTDPLPFLISGRSWSFDEAFALWERWVEASRRTVDAHAGPSLCLRYEDLLEDPESEIGRLAEFCGLELGPNRDQLVAGLEQERRYAFLTDPDLRDLYEKFRDSTWMRALGYGDLSNSR